MFPFAPPPENIRKPKVKDNSFCRDIKLINPLLAHVLILYPLKTLENIWFCFLGGIKLGHQETEIQPGITNLSSKKNIIDMSVEANSNHKVKFENTVVVTEAPSEFNGVVN